MRIEQVLVNVLSSAVKPGAGAPIFLRVEVDGEKPVDLPELLRIVERYCGKD